MLAGWYKYLVFSMFSIKLKNKRTILFLRFSDVYYANSIIKNFQEFLTNLFQPLFEATIDPSSHPNLFRFMHHLTGFDCVDDETKPEKPVFTTDMPHPNEWNMKDNPPYVYYLVRYIYSFETKSEPIFLTL